MPDPATHCAPPAALQDEISKRITAGSAENIGKYVVQRFKLLKLLHTDFEFSKGCLRDVVFAATVDNASAEAAAVVDEIGCYLQRDVPHTVNLILSDACKSKQTSQCDKDSTPAVASFIGAHPSVVPDFAAGQPQ